MKTTDIQVIAIRALNHLRREFLPSYVGLRRLLATLSEEYKDEYLLQYILNKPLTQSNQAYHDYTIFKDSKDGKLHYRNCLSPSPTTCLVEAVFLDILSKFDSFRNHKDVYSYLWPDSDKSGYSYKYFLDGYRERELCISRTLRDKPDHHAFITDIKQFYPSIDKSIIITNFEK